MHRKRLKPEEDTEEEAVAVTAPGAAAWVEPRVEPGAVRVASVASDGATSSVASKATATGLPREPDKTEGREDRVASVAATSRVVSKATATGLLPELVKTMNRVALEDSEAASLLETVTEPETANRVTLEKATDSATGRELSLEAKALTAISAEKEATETAVNIAMSILHQPNMERAITETPKVTERPPAVENTTAAKMPPRNAEKVIAKTWTPTDKPPKAVSSTAAKMSPPRKARA